MSELIQWPLAKYWDTPWNPMVGCRHASPACDNCYARTAMVERFGQSFEPHPSKKQTPPRKGVVFCGNMTDLFGEWNIVHEGGGYSHKAWDWIAETLGRDKRNPYKDKATYLWLTKRAGVMAEWVLDGGWEDYHDYWTGEGDGPDFADCDMSNQYFGITAENQAWFDDRVGQLVDAFCGPPPKWLNLWLSAEPLLGPMDIASGGIIHMFKWVVVGCESGPNRRPCGMGWVESIAAQCMNAKIPLFIKQLDINGRCETDIDKFPAHLRIRQVPWAAKGAEA